ncbi:alpha/beta fold hydrolase [Plebeiibacterium marinum]|uniref:Alpha/beta hydrolase n=1 Tax=Plebeiibacterium marinum TaxID=2992111 RepID=A0AAE3SJD1_9BACT|nr:alpha/beta hydrolase [Plebeiobacterium marinum]MCW3804220.1 alpha/beta hydrolase [Plebeiobacterium marinum]
MEGLVQKSLMIQDHELNYYEAGTGTPVLFVHGISTYSFIWRKIVPSFVDLYRVIVVDLFGCGRSDLRVDISYSLSSHASYLHQFMAKLNIDKFHLVSHDVGGGIAQIMSVMHPDRIKSATLINTVAYNFWPVQPIISMRTPIFRQFAAATLDLWTLKLIVKRGLYHPGAFTEELVELFRSGINSKPSRKSFLHFAKCLNNNDLMSIVDELHNLDTPILIIRGVKDVYLGAAITHELVKNLKNCTGIRIETAGHYAQEDEPGVIIKEVKNFLELNEK